jgi:alkylation response protein AidB-like acyl-CoA dehydrogenase
MSAIRPRDLLSDDLLESLGGTAKRPAGDQGAVARDLAVLAEAGYLSVALPPELGGLGCTLRQAACGQRRLARYAPRTALAVSAHLYWTGAAADACRSGDDSVRWILQEAAGGALFAAGHGGPAGQVGGDLRLADPRSRCEPVGDGGYQFADVSVLATGTPSWDWVAVHAVHHAATARSVIAFAGRGRRCTPAFRVARVQPVGTPWDVFLTSALTWGHSVIASVQYSDARRAFNLALTAYAESAAAAWCGDAEPPAARAGGPAPAADAAAGPVPAGRLPEAAGRWPVAEAGTVLDAMKARIAMITHPWPLVQQPAPDLGGQHLIGLHAMRHEVAEGATRVHQLISQITGAPAPAGPLAP